MSKKENKDDKLRGKFVCYPMMILGWLSIFLGTTFGIFYNYSETIFVRLLYIGTFWLFYGFMTMLLINLDKWEYD